jgi:hypothetical protein
MIKARSLDIGVSALLALAGVYIAWQGMTYGYLDANVPDAGFFPVWIGLGLFVFSAINLFRLIRQSGQFAVIDRAELGRVLLCSLAIAIFAVLSQFVGTIAAALFLIFAVGAVFGPRNRRFYVGLAAVSVVSTAVLYLIFGVLLSVPLL